MPETVTLEFLARQLERVLAEQASMRDDISVLTAIALRQENTLKDALGQMRAMVAQHQRFNNRLRRLEEQQPAE